MAVFRIEKTRDYTVMSNHHLKDRTLTLKSKGLLSMMLSLPDEWNYTTRGLAAICREGVDSIGAALKELETHGYIRRTQLRDEKGKITDTEYVIYEMPQCEPPSNPGTPLPGTAKPYTENPDMGIPDTADPCTENPAQLNTNQTKTDLSSTELSNPIQSNPPTPTGARMGTDRMGARECYREVILDNIEYSYLVQDSHIDREQLDEIVDLIVDTVCSARKVIRIAGDDYPAEVVKSRFMKLDSSHVQYVMDCMKDNTTYVRNIKKYLLAALGQTQEDYLPSEIEKFKDATGYEEFLDFDPAEVKAALEDPEKSHADEMLSAAERAASEKMTVLVVEPMKEPYVKEIDPDLHSLQAEVGGDIGATYPYSDPVALVCNDEGKLIGLDLNRGLRDEDGEIYDIVAGTFLVVGLGEEDFASLSPELIQKYTEQFKTPERFMQINGNIVVLPVPAEKQDLTYLPDRFETGERVQTPRGSFQVTAMSREQMEAAGYGVHHISDDGKYLIMGNGTRAFAVAAEQPEKDNPLRTAEMTLEDDYGMIDGVINNGRRGEELEKAQEYAERTTPEKPSIRERLEDAKRECAEHKPPEGKKPGRDVPEHDCL